MRKKKKQRLKEQQFWATFTYINKVNGLAEIPAHLERVNFRIWDSVGDEDLARMVTKVKSINMLDLDETDITDEGVALLTQLEYIRDLRLKGIHQLTDDCLPSINKMTSLELLHLGGTGVTLDGVSKLSGLKKLKTLLVSAGEEENTPERIGELAKLFPGCELIVNHKLFYPPMDELTRWQQ